MWEFNGRERPSFALKPKKNQESVWDYPRPPRIKLDERDIQVYLNVLQIAHTRKARKIMETASPPTFYLPTGDVDMSVLKPNQQTSFCEWKGQALYYDFSFNDINISSVAWSYPNPTNQFKVIKNHIAFYPSKLKCHINGELVSAQQGGFYGGWITTEIIGPFKGEVDTQGW